MNQETHSFRSCSRRTLFLAGCLAVVLAAIGRAGERPNIVLFVADDLSPTLGCYGDPVAKTPHIDALAKAGVRFSHAFATTASCSASRSVVLTGMHNHANAHYGHAHGFHHFSSYDELKSLPVLLTEAGYRTGSCGKFHVKPEAVYQFETRIRGNGRNTVQTAKNCAEFIAKRDAPFFLYFCTSDPHRGGAGDGLPHRPNRFGNVDGGYPGVTPVTYDPAEVPVPPFLPDTPVCRAELAQYYQSVSRVDQGLGQLVKELKKAGQFENTIIIFTSDHGIAMPGGKTTTYEPGLHVPFVIKPAGAVTDGIVNPALVSLVDLAPSILDFAEAPPVKWKRSSRQSFHGRSFKPILTNRNPKGWDEINASHTFHEITMYYPMRVVRGRQYKLIWNIAHGLPYPFAGDLWHASTWQHQYEQGMDAPFGRRTVREYIHRPKFELFDLKKDPDEVNNLAENPKFASVLAKMKDRLQEFQQRTKDPWRMKWKYE